MNAMATRSIQPPRRGNKRARPAAEALPSVITEHGLELRYGRGDVTVEHRAPEVDDPNRTVSRPLAVSASDRLFNRGAISKPQHLATQRYAELREAEIGARWQNGEANGRNPHQWQKGHPVLTQIQAATNLRRLHEALGGRARVIVTLLIVDNLPVSGIAVRFGRNDPITRRRIPADERRLMGEVDAVLTRMVEFWGLDNDAGR